jgi:hypothetical protein
MRSASRARARRRAWGSAALSLCTVAHPLYTRVTKTISASFSETKMRPSLTPHLLLRQPGVRRERQPLAASKVLAWPKRCKLAHAFLWEYSYERLKLVQLLAPSHLLAEGRRVLCGRCGRCGRVSRRPRAATRREEGGPRAD